MLLFYVLTFKLLESLQCKSRAFEIEKIEKLMKRFLLLGGYRNESGEVTSFRTEDLKFVHELNNNAHIMSYWFEEPYEAFVGTDLYDKHIAIKVNADLSLKR